MTIAEEIGSGLLPTVHIRNTALHMGHNKISFVSTLSIKDSLDENNVFRWVETIIQQLAKITFVCVEVSTGGTNSDLANDLNNGVVMPMDTNGLSPGVTKITYSLSNFVLDLDNFHITDGQNVYDVDLETQTIVLDFPEDIIDKVFIYTCMHIDLEDAASFLGVVADFGDIDHFSSMIASEKLIDNGEPVTTTVSFVTEDGLPYAGMVEPLGEPSGELLISPAGYITPSGETLTQVAIPNQSLTITEVDMGVSTEELELPTTSPFSEIFYSIDKNENLVGNFLFDPQSLIVENMEIPSKIFAANPSEFASMYGSVDYKMMEIFRIETKQGTQFTNDRDNIVVRTHNSKGSMFSSKDKYLFEDGLKANVTTADLPEVLEGARIIDENNLSKQDLQSAEKIGSVEEIEIGLESERLISFTDNRVGKSERGNYTYGVRFLVSNDFDDVVRERMRMLSMGISMVNNYYKAAMFGQKFSIKTGNFKSEYIDKLKESYTEDSETPWIEPVVRYEQANKLIAGTEMDLSPIIASLNPDTATDSSIRDVVDKMEKLLNDLRDYYDISELENKSNDTSAESSADSKGSDLIEFTFSEVIGSNDFNRAGFEYFDQESESILKISKLDFSIRAGKEKSKFFNSNPANSGNSNLSDLETNLYAYFTPLKIKTGAVHVKLNGSTTSATMKFINSADPQGLDSESSAADDSNSMLTPTISGNSSIMANSLGIIIGKPAKSKTQKRKFVDGKKVVGERSDFMSKTKDYSPETKETAEEELENDELLTAMSMDRKDLGSATLNLQSFTKLPSIPEDVLNLPLQLKAIYLRDDKSTNFKFEGSDPFANPVTRKTAEFNFTKIRQIEYLSGFEKSSNLSLMKSPVWKILKKEDFRSLEGNVICRMVPYSSDFYGTMDKDNLKDYDTMFIIEA